jgi:isoprenylcysteine carboxyl methyltransferase (ICMT) family protein YpbQ
MRKNPDSPQSDSLKSTTHDSNTIEEKKGRGLGLKEDWAVIPYLVLIVIGFIVSIIDFVLVQMLRVQLVWMIIGIPVLVFGSIMRTLPRRSLIKAGFGSIFKTPYLQIVKDHQLVTEGYYKDIRHPSTLVNWDVLLDGQSHSLAYMG